MTPGDWINAVVALATVGMAGATYYLARATGQLATDTAGATAQADRHHQENLRPFCVMSFSDASEAAPFGSDFAPEGRRLKPLVAGSGEITQQPVI